MTDFDARAKSWDDVPGRQERAQAVAEAIRQEVHLSTAMSALEYGCGTGLLSFALQPYLGAITLADNSRGMLEVLWEKINSSGASNMTPLLLDLSKDPLPDQKFDLLYTLMVLHHIPDTVGILQKFHAVLKPTGILCIADLDLEDGSFHEYEFEGHHGFARQELTMLLEKAGFEGIRFTTPYSVEKHSRHYPLFLAVGAKK